MPTATRIYVGEAEGKKYLVDTNSMGNARTAIAKKHITVRLAKPSEIVTLLQNGTEVLKPLADPAQTDVEDPSA